MGIFFIRGSPFPYGDPHIEMGRETEKIPYGDSPYRSRVCSNLGINIYPVDYIGPLESKVLLRLGRNGKLMIAHDGIVEPHPKGL